MTGSESRGSTTWTARPWLARLIRLAVFLIPLVVSIAAAFTLSAVVPQAESMSVAVARWLGIAAVSTGVLALVDKVARRLLPLATLFGLTLAFPDQAPSRFRIALRNGSTAQLRKRIAQAQAGEPVDTPAAAAERVLELVIALNTHDRLTRGHSERVRAYTQMIGEEMGLTDRELDRLRWSGLLHDIGKLRISSAILNKPGKLTDAEFDEIKLHPEYGRQLVAPLVGWLGESARAVWEHHERWDGRGYPHGLSGTDISLAGRIVSVADTYDVITSVRSYKKAISPAEARAELTRCAGTQFDPAVVRAFMNVSLGRLRLAMGPLSWLAQVPLFPQVVSTTAAAGTTGAATALVGAAAASMGLGLAGEQLVPTDTVAFADERPAAVARAYPEIDTSPRSRGDAGADVAGDGGEHPGAAAGTGGETGVEPGPGGGAPGAVDPGSAGDTGGISGAAEDPPTGAPPTSTTVAGRPTPTTTTAPRPTTTVPGAAATATTTTTTAPAVTTTLPVTGTTAPPATTTAPLLTLPPITIPPLTLPPLTLPPLTLPPITLPPLLPTTTAPPTTVAPRPDWLPPAGVATAYYLDPPEFVDLAARPVLPLTTVAPTALLVADADGDGRTGITLARTPPGQPAPPTGELIFGLDAPTEARLQGPASGAVYASTTSLLASTVSVRARLMVCDAGGGCSVISERTGNALVTVLALPISFDFGTVDATIPAGGSLRVVFDVPSSSSGDVLISSDAVLAPASITVRFA